MMVPARALLALCLVHVLGLFSLVAYAQPVPATDPVPRVAFPLRVSGNVTTVGPRTVDAANAAKFSFGAASNGAVFADTGLDLPTPGGRSVPITAHGSIPKASVAGALGRFASKVVGPLAIGVAIYDLAKELGFGMDNSSGSVAITKQAPARADGTWEASATYPDTGGYVQACNAAYAPGPFYVDPQCGVYAANVQPGAYCGGFRSVPGVCVEVRAGVTPTGQSLPPQQGRYVHQTLRWAPNETYAPSQVPSTSQELADAIAAKSGWPTSSALARATRDAVLSGESLPVEVSQLTGPATSPGPVTVTDSPADNTRTTTTTTNRHTYNGPDVATTVERVTQVTDLTSGAPIGSPVVTTETPALRTPTEQPELKTCGLPGTPACKIDETGTPSTLPSTGQEALSTAADARDAIIPAITSTTDKNTSWGLVPKWLIGAASCSPTVLFTLPPVLGSREVSIDFCPHLDAMYLVMNFLWVAWTMQACIALVRDTTLGA